MSLAAHLQLDDPVVKEDVPALLHRATQRLVVHVHLRSCCFWFVRVSTNTDGPRRHPIEAQKTPLAFSGVPLSLKAGSVVRINSAPAGMSTDLAPPSKLHTVSGYT